MAIKMSIEINELIQIPSQLLRQDKILIVMSLLQHLTLHLNNSQHWSIKKQLSDESSRFSTVILHTISILNCCHSANLKM